MRQFPATLRLFQCCFVCFSLFLTAGWTQEKEKETSEKLMPAGDVRTKIGFYSMVFYYTPDPAADPKATAKALVKSLMPEVTFVLSPKDAPAPPFVAFEEETAPLEQFPVPEAGYFKYAGRGLSDDDIAGIQKTSRATRLLLLAPPLEVWKLGRQFTQLVHDFAVETKAFVWDSATRECFTSEAWKDKRLAGWPADGVPQISSQTTIHLYRHEEGKPFLRAITLGMEKFALPDVSVEGLVSSDHKPAGNLINLVCQSLAERPKVEHPKAQIFSLDALKAGKQKKEHMGSLKEGATGAIKLELLEVDGEEGDPENRIIKLSFRNGEGASDGERKQNLLSKLWGASDSVMGIKHDEEITAASKAAKEKLLKLRPAFIKGLEPGERILVKAPFPRDDSGDEWMWVEVLQWDAEKVIDGVLQNDPFFISKLKAGAKVQVKADEIFDYIYYRTDGSKEGNETGKLMEKQNGPKQSRE